MTFRENLRSIAAIPELRTYFLIYLLVIFGLNLNSSIFFLYPLKLGLSFLEMTFVYFSLSRIVELIALVPTGALADKVSTKWCLVLAFLSLGIAHLCRGILPFIMLPLAAFIISEILMGLGDSTLDGALEKYLYSFRQRVKDSALFSVNDGLMFAMRAIGCLAGGFVVFYSAMRWTQIIGGVFILIGSVLAIRYIGEPKYETHSGSIVQLYKEGFSFAYTHRETFALITGVSLLGIGIYGSRNVMQPLLENLGLNIDTFAVAFGLIFSIQMVFSSVGSFLVTRIERHVGLTGFLALTLMTMALLLFFLPFVSVIFLAVLIIWLIAYTEGSYITQYTLLLNRHVKEEHTRATITSIASLASAVVIIIAIPIVGWVTDNWGIQANLWLSSASVLVGSITLYLPRLSKHPDGAA